MSQNPWPYVVVMLGSLGFLANLMAQQDNRFSNRAEFGARNGTNSQARDRRGWGSGSANESTVRVRPKDDAERTNPTRGLPEPFFDNSDADAADVAVPFDEIVENRRPRRGSNFRRDTDAEMAQIPIQPRMTTPVPERESISSPVGGGRAPFPTSQRRERGNGFNANPQRRYTPDSIERKIDDAQFAGSQYKTKQSSLFDTSRAPGSLEPRFGVGDASLFGDNKSLPKNAPSTNTNKPTLGSEIPSLFGGTNDTGLENRGQTKDASGLTPTWFKWALFFSVGANIFFGYIAMNMHLRYQDLIEDMHASESRLERQRPRRRVQERDEEPIGSRARRRDADEAAFLQGGIEV